MTPDLDPDPQPRPPDVTTGFWLWVSALPLLVAAYVVDLVTAPLPVRPWFLTAISAVFVVVLAAVVLTFMFLMRQGYRWARTLLTGGGATTVFYVATNLFTVDRTPAAAVIFAGCSILGSVLICGGIYLLHRKDVYAYFGGR